eukprot:scaffold429_cov269-Pinguiococcus_pyrenoidosus.AAC.31
MGVAIVVAARPGPQRTGRLGHFPACRGRFAKVSAGEGRFRSWETRGGPGRLHDQGAARAHQTQASGVRRRS